MEITFPRNAFARLAAVTMATATMTSISLRDAIRRGPAQRPGSERDVEKAMRLAERAKAPVAGSLLDARVGPIGPYLGASRR
jgi:hypothetical protein